MKRLLTSAIIAFGMVAGAAAANADNTQSTQSSSPGAASTEQNASNNGMTGSNGVTGQGDHMNHANLRQQLQSQLSGAGYTDIKITPSSFFIQAKDKSGNPVSMVVGPDTFTEVTTLDSNTGRAASQSESGAKSQNGTMAPQSPNSQQTQMGTQSTQKQ